MKNSHFGIKLSIFILIIIILATNLVYWKSVSTLSDHINSLIVLSNHQENGEIFHSAIHSMMMNSSEADLSRYNVAQQKADNALHLMQTYIESMPDGDSKNILLNLATRMAEKYISFKEYTNKLIREDSATLSSDAPSTQELFDYIFTDYKKLFYHHSEQRKKLLVESKSIKSSTKILQMLVILTTIVLGLLVILYLDRVTFKLFEITEKMALRDKLTGLYNRHALERFIAQLHPASAKNADNKYGIILVDIDHFKRFNDTHGHSAGDKVLVQIANTLLEMVRTVDKVIRFGGEEILILLPRASSEGTAIVAQKISRAIDKKPFHIQENSDPVHVTVSIGYSAHPPDKRSFQEVLDTADRSLYTAKARGRNKVVGPEHVN
jgi:diguanylate cyclase (GGDEF)-like protein